MKNQEVMLEDRTARLTVLVDPNKKKAFEELCLRLDTTASQALRQMMRDFLAQHHVSWTPEKSTSKKSKGRPAVVRG